MRLPVDGTNTGLNDFEGAGPLKGPASLEDLAPKRRKVLVDFRGGDRMRVDLE